MKPIECSCIKFIISIIIIVTLPFVIVIIIIFIRSIQYI